MAGLGGPSGGRRNDRFSGMYVWLDYGGRQPRGAPGGTGGRFAKGFNRDDRQTMNRSQAETMQDWVGEHIRASMVRPNVSTGRLFEATMSSRNVEFSTDGWAVGIPEHLNTSQAKYWRTIEEGSRKVWGESGKSMVGMKIKGTFGATRGGFGTNQWGRVLHAGPGFTNPGKGSGGKFRPGGKGFKGQEAIITKNIRAHSSYEKAWRRFTEGGQLQELVANEAASLLGRRGDDNGVPRRTTWS